MADLFGVSDRVLGPLLAAGLGLAACYHHSQRAHAPAPLLGAERQTLAFRGAEGRASLWIERGDWNQGGLESPAARALWRWSARGSARAEHAVSVHGATRRVLARVDGGRLWLRVEGVAERPEVEVPWGPSSRLDPGLALASSTWLEDQPDGGVRVVRLEPADPRGRIIEHWRVETRDEGRVRVATAERRRIAVLLDAASQPSRVRVWTRGQGGGWRLVEDWRRP